MQDALTGFLVGVVFTVVAVFGAAAWYARNGKE